MSPRAAWRLESLGFTQVYDYVPGKADWLAAGLPREGEAAPIPVAGDVARNAPICHFREKLATVRARLQQDGEEGCIAVNDEGIVMGIVRPGRLDLDDDVTIEQIMTPSPTTVRASESLAALTDRMKRARVRDILVTTPEGHLIGRLYRDEAEDLLCPGEQGR
jgi:predicted transcriptional regulator